MKHKDFEILRSEEKHNTSLNILDVVEERDIDDQNTSNLNSLHPCPLCKDDDSYCCCGVCEECEYLITEECLSTHIMNQHEPSDVIAGLGQQWAKDQCPLFSGIQTVQMIGGRVLSGTSSICDLSTLLYFLIFPICPVCVLPQ